MTEETKRNKKKWDESEAWFNKEYPDHDDGCLYGKIVVKAAYTAGADSREKRIDELEDKLANADYQLEGRDNEIRELKAQIEKMKNCKNCANYMISGKCCCFFRTGWCKNWEMTKGDKRK